jgi:hypothetical protein
VRLLAIENCTAIAKILSLPDNHVHILPLVKSCADDKSWRVRSNVAKEFFPVLGGAPGLGTRAVSDGRSLRGAVRDVCSCRRRWVPRRPCQSCCRCSSDCSR